MIVSTPFDEAFLLKFIFYVLYFVLLYFCHCFMSFDLYIVIRETRFLFILIRGYTLINGGSHRYTCSTYAAHDQT